MIEDKVTSDSDLLRAFMFRSWGATLSPCCPTAVALHLLIHTHCNEVIETCRLLASADAEVTLEVPLMLRDKLKVMAAKDSLYTRVCKNSHPCYIVCCVSI